MRSEYIWGLLRYMSEAHRTYRHWWDRDPTDLGLQCISGSQKKKKKKKANTQWQGCKKCFAGLRPHGLNGLSHLSAWIKIKEEKKRWNPSAERRRQRSVIQTVWSWLITEKMHQAFLDSFWKWLRARPQRTSNKGEKNLACYEKHWWKDSETYHLRYHIE